MSERKVLTKYYPPDWDPAKVTRTRKISTGPRLQPVRLMAPFSMQCTSCGEFIYKGRKFNARKETTDEKYYAIPIYRFYIRCTRCSAEITFKTDPKNMDYTCERGAKRNFEPWRAAKLAEETEEERLDRLEREEAEHDAMAELEQKALDAKTEMAVADALDEIRTRNARNESGVAASAAAVAADAKLEQREREEREDEEAARRAFARNGADGRKVEGLSDGVVENEQELETRPVAAESTVKEEIASIAAPTPAPAAAAPPTFQRVVKKKKDLKAALGIKKKPALV